MNSIKERLFGAITVMDDDMATSLWHYVLKISGHSWNDIKEVEPDSVDLQMIQDAESDPDCRTFD